MRRYTSKKYVYAPALGVKTDFETLLQKFTETGTVRFQDFSEIWRDMKFSKYCAGRQTQREVREVSQYFQDCQYTKYGLEVICYFADSAMSYVVKKY